MKKGIDISTYNAVSDYAAVARTVSFAVLKIINASNVEDKRFATHLTGCRTYNIPVLGVYNYSYAETTAKAKSDAQAVIRTLQKYSLNTIVWLDIEEQAIAKRLGSALIDIVLTYKNTINAAGYQFGVYTGMSYYNSYLKKYESRLDGIPMWIARYPSSATMTIDKDPSESKKPAIRNIVAWQYSSKGSIPGIAGNVDLNILYDEGLLSGAPSAPAAPATTSSKYYPKYTGATNTSIVSGLAGVGEKDTSYTHRCKIAKANGITGYTGTAKQNLYMLDLLKQGKLIKA